jgi:hypothetical protein
MRTWMPGLVFLQAHAIGCDFWQVISGITLPKPGMSQTPSVEGESGKPE